MQAKRQLIVLRGSAEQTQARAKEVVGALDPEQVLWLGPGRGRQHLGRTVDAVVLDLHRGLAVDTLAQSQGFIRAGGALILRLSPDPPLEPGLALHPYGPEQVGRRTWARLERALAEDPDQVVAPAAVLTAPERQEQGTAEQARIVEALVEAMGRAGQAVVLTGERGRGKSAAMGLAVQALCQREDRRVVLTGVSPEAVAEVFRFALGAPIPVERGPVRWMDPEALVEPGGADPEVLLIDEAAALPLPTLQALVRAHPRASVVFCTTTAGYEGSGQGFLLKFLGWLQAHREVQRLELTQPIRWGPDDPLERFIHRVLLLDARPAEGVEPGQPIEAVCLDRDALAADEPTLRALFGLLMQAHYRTTPSDLYHLLDGPNLAIHALTAGGQVVGACVVAREGELPVEMIQDVAQGKRRIRGHALPDTLISHSGRPEAGAMRIIRSVRTAVHPALRGLGLGRRLVEHVHQTYDPDFFGTLFGATEALIRFRQALGYEVVRLGGSRGARTGLPAVVMIRPVTARAEALVRVLRQELARNIPVQSRLLKAEAPLEPGMLQRITHDLPPATPWTAEERQRVLVAYTWGMRTYDAASGAVSDWVAEQVGHLEKLPAPGRALIEARVRQERSWRETARAAQIPTVNAAMRALRRAVRALMEIDRVEAERLHLALLLRDLPLGGVERVTLNLARGLLRYGRVSLVLFEARGPLLEEVPEGVEVVDLAGSGDLRSAPWQAPKVIRRLARWLDEQRPDAVISSKEQANTALVLARRKAAWDGPILLTRHVPLDRRARALYRNLYAEADLLVGVSHGLAEELRGIAGIHRVRQIPTAVWGDQLPEVVPAEHPWREGEAPLLVCVGRLHPQKGQDLLLDALAQVPEARLILVGEGPMRSRLERQIARLGLGSRVQLLGAVRDAAPWLAAADLVVLPSRYEGLPTVVIEALAYKVPVLAADCPTGPSELLPPDRLVPPEDPEALARGIERVLADPTPSPLDWTNYLARGVGVQWRWNIKVLLAQRNPSADSGRPPPRAHPGRRGGP